MFEQRIKLAILFVIFFILQYSFFPFFRLNHAIPDLLSILIVFYGFYKRSLSFFLFAFLIGLFKDFFSEAFFGIQGLAYFISAIFVSLFLRKIPQNQTFYRILTLFSFITVSTLVLLLDPILSGIRFHFFDLFWYRLWPVIFYTTLLSVVLLPALQGILKHELRQYNLF